MSDMQPTYEFEDGLVTASINGKIVASGSTIEEVETEVAAIVETPVKTASRKPTHIIGPGGIKGQILTRTASTWGEEVTVRFENGEFRTIPVSDRTQFTTENPKTASSSPLERLKAGIEKVAGTSRTDLQARFTELEAIKFEAREHITKGASNEDLHAFHNIIVTADLEQQEIRDHAEYLNATEGEGYQPYKPEMQIIDAPNIGHQNDGTWLDATLADIREEAQETDFNKLLDDGPTTFVAEQEDVTLSDSGDVRERALSHIRSKTAGLQSDQLDAYENLFLARVEEARRVELAHRKQTVKKEAAQKQSDVDNAPVESLFL